MRRFLRTTLLACLLAVTAVAVAEEPAETLPPQPSNIVTCSTGAPFFLDCAYERVNWSLFGLEGGVGARLVVDERNADTFSLTPFVVFGYYGDTQAVWVEITTPEGIVPLIGNDPQIVTVGGEYRW